MKSIVMPGNRNNFMRRNYRHQYGALFKFRGGIAVSYRTRNFEGPRRLTRPSVARCLNVLMPVRIMSEMRGSEGQCHIISRLRKVGDICRVMKYETSASRGAAQRNLSSL